MLPQARLPFRHSLSWGQAVHKCYDCWCLASGQLSPYVSLPAPARRLGTNIPSGRSVRQPRPAAGQEGTLLSIAHALLEYTGLFKLVYTIVVLPGLSVILGLFHLSAVPSTIPEARRWPLRFSALRRLRQRTPAPPSVGCRRSHSDWQFYPSLSFSLASAS